MDCQFMPGDVVVCIHVPDDRHVASANAVLVEGSIYNIREITLGTLADGTKTPSVWLAQEETHWYTRAGKKGYWNHTWFRLVYRPDGKFISMLTRGIDDKIKAKV
jgi:hypothetical protein